MSPGIAKPASEPWSSELTGSEVFSPHSGVFGDARLSGGSVWLYCGTSNIAAMPDEWLSKCVIFGAFFGHGATSVGVHELDESSETQRLIRELRNRSGLTWSELATVFDVDRRALHFWANGSSPAEHNASRLRHVVDVVRQVDQGDPKRTKRLLTYPRADGHTVVELLADEQFGAALAAAYPTEKQPRPKSERKRPPRLSAAVRSQRQDFAPEELLGAAQSDEYQNGRFLTSFSLMAAED